MEQLLSIISSSNDPAFNLAVEEHLLKNRKENIHFFYINNPSVIIGKHQNALAEVNLPFLEKKEISLFRRLSGGGTVYHDLGNINYCFIKTGETGDLVNFKKATEPITTVLNSWGIPARSGQRNDLLVHYKKISGNACHVFKSRVMHHGTLLYQSDLSQLTESLKSDAIRFRDKAVKSVRSEVVNLKDALGKDWSAETFLQNLESALRAITPASVLYKLTADEEETILKLKTEKYDTWEWNYGYGPTYSFRKRIQADNSLFSVELEVVKGKIAEIKLSTNHPDPSVSGKIIHDLTGCYHHKETLIHKLNEIKKEIPQLPDPNTLIQLFF
jgi:lipoate-protein ligase A